jgi:hypothetical protein
VECWAIYLYTLRMLYILAPVSLIAYLLGFKSLSARIDKRLNEVPVVTPKIFETVHFDKDWPDRI